MEYGVVSKSQCPHLPGLRVVYACVNQAFALLDEVLGGAFSGLTIEFHDRSLCVCVVLYLWWTLSLQTCRYVHIGTL